LENEIHFITNDVEMPAKAVTDVYKRRWDIEVFFRFIKQELNFKHFLSVNKNGLQVMLYMTLITAMLLMNIQKN
jgi:IS4 transposase